MIDSQIFPNGINGSTGRPIDDYKLTFSHIAEIARNKRLIDSELYDAKVRKRLNEGQGEHYGVINGVDMADISQAGWAVIFPASLSSDEINGLKEALKPLLDLRKQQASKNNPVLYQEFIGERGYEQGESKNDFLNRFGCGPGEVNPTGGVPFYLLIVGSPEMIPFSFQYQLDFQYGVGRIFFECLEDYSIYASTVVASEKHQFTLEKKATFFGPNHDGATQLSSEYLVKPLAEKLANKHNDWTVTCIDSNQATKEKLTSLLYDSVPPALLFSATHGLGFDIDDPQIITHTGSLVCQDFLTHPGGRISNQYYFSADDLTNDANVKGTIAFIFACFGAGSPRFDNFYHSTNGQKKEIARYSFISQLPQKLLSHPKGGALGVYAHVERAWGCSFLWNNAIMDIETFTSMLNSLLDGKPAGAAIDHFGARFGDIAIMLNDELEGTTQNYHDARKIAWLWTCNNDARNYIFIGDPAVRLAINS